MLGLVRAQHARLLSRAFGGKRGGIGLSSPDCQNLTPSCNGLVPGSRKLSSRSDPRRSWLAVTSFFALGLAAGSLSYTLLHWGGNQNSLDPKTFKPFVLSAKKRVSSTSSIFTLLPSTQTISPNPYNEAWRQGVWSVQIKQPQLQIARAYTPLPPGQRQEHPASDDSLEFLIRQDPKGEVSGYLHKLPIGATIDVRGPQGEYAVPFDLDEIIFIAGGTGIAPALQVAHTLFEVRAADAPSPKLHILWANRRREDCVGGIGDTPTKPPSRVREWFSASPFGDSLNTATAEAASLVSSPLVRRIQDLRTKQPGKFSIDYYVDEERTSISATTLKHHLQPSEKIDQGLTGRKLILVSGPDGFVEHFAGRKVWQNGREVQGKLGGLLSQVDHSGWEVWKL
ncbi:mitochondrial peripheral inner membrane protein [Ptychographa xylographoides]|nr:mitochondrial peripheral inner membrane protein [Ptychographa xylographoides]